MLRPLLAEASASLAFGASKDFPDSTGFLGPPLSEASLMIFWASMPEPGSKASKEINKPEPSADPYCRGKLASACLSASLSSVGDCAKAAVPAIVTKPTRNRAGLLSMNLRAASCAASMRDGFKSLARMLPEVSRASMTVASRSGAIRTDCGRAMAMQSRPSPRLKMMGGKRLVK